MLSLWMLALLSCAVSILQNGRPRPEVILYEATKRFLQTLDPVQRKKMILPFDSEERLNWHYIPKDRMGLAYKEMTPTQQLAALDLLRAVLSSAGYEKITIIRLLESVLREIERGSGPVRDTELYYFTVFGEPSLKGTWGLRYEGHHISLNWTVVEGKAVATSPQFLGANPAEVRQGPMKGVRALRAEEDLARALLASLTPEQRKEAVLSDTAPPDILTGHQRIAAIQEDRGIAYCMLNQTQRGILLALLEEYASVQPKELARHRLDTLRKAGLDNIKFAWMGSLERGKGHYYRIQGPTFLIEYDNTQNNANHIHTVWRDFKGDWGMDLLEHHYRTSPHHTGK